MADNCGQADPYHYKDRAIIIGDASHCMVPFYGESSTLTPSGLRLNVDVDAAGQGMNCGFEDVRILRSLLLANDIPASPSLSSTPLLSSALSQYSRTRHDDLIAICALAMRNYTEMRSDVATWSYRARKTVDFYLAKLLKGRWLPL